MKTSLADDYKAERRFNKFLNNHFKIYLNAFCSLDKAKVLLVARDQKARSGNERFDCEAFWIDKCYDQSKEVKLPALLGIMTDG